MSARLTADFWVRAYLTRLRLADIPAFVTARGDATAGAVLVKCATLDGQARAFQRSFDLMTAPAPGCRSPKAPRPMWMRPLPASAASIPTSG